MKSHITEDLINTIRNALPAKNSLVDSLMDLLNIGKEAAYRRIRGDVPFTLDEIAKISIKYQISLDKIISVNDSYRAIFDINTYTSDPFTSYICQLERDINFFKRMGEEHYKIIMAVNTLPYPFYLEYEGLTKFRIYKWLYQRYNDPGFLFSKLKIPTNVLTSHKSLLDILRLLENFYIIIDEYLFSSMINEIAFFYKRRLLSEEDVELLQKELLALLEKLEKIATSGTDKNGCEVNMYLSSINLDASYFYIKGNKTESARIKIYAIENIDTQNPNICIAQKRWIESLKKFSTMITQSGEIERIRYFTKQKEMINSIDKLL